jgi:hypothetical protein
MSGSWFLKFVSCHHTIFSRQVRQVRQVRNGGSAANKATSGGIWPQNGANNHKKIFGPLGGRKSGESGTQGIWKDRLKQAAAVVEGTSTGTFYPKKVQEDMKWKRALLVV